MSNEQTFVHQLGWLLGSMGLMMFLVACAVPTQPTNSSTNQPAAQPTNLQTTEPTTPAPPTILAFGDSLTAGLGVDEEMAYPAQLEQKLQSAGYNYRVINGGISGETSTAALNRLDWMLQTNPDIVIIETGGNDALRGIDLTLTEANISEMVRRFQAEDVIVVLAGLQIIQNLGDDYTNQFAAMYPRIAAEYPDVIFIPFFLEGVAANPDLNQADFIHPTAEGYTVIVEHIFPFIVEAINRHQEKNEG
jgi:acyl-CoA thioesterase I